MPFVMSGEGCGAMAGYVLALLRALLVRADPHAQPDPVAKR
jgi:hypothetical protein